VGTHRLEDGAISEVERYALGIRLTHHALAAEAKLRGAPAPPSFLCFSAV